MPILTVIVLIEISIIVFLLGYNIYISKKVDYIKESKTKLQKMAILKDVLNIAAKPIGLEEKMEELNEFLINKMNINSSTIVYFDSNEYHIKATNLKEAERQSILEIPKLNILSLGIKDNQFKYLTVEKETDNLPYLKSKRASSALIIPFNKMGIHLGYWVLESRKMKAFENIDTDIIHTIKESIVNVILLMYHERAFETITKKDVYSDLKTAGYMHSEGKRKLDSVEKSIVAIVEIVNILDINESLSRNAGNQAIKELAQIFKKHFPENVVCTRYLGPKFALAFVGEENEEKVKNILNNIKQDIENIEISLSAKGEVKVKNVKEEEIDFIDELTKKEEKPKRRSKKVKKPYINFAYSKYTKYTSLDLLLRKLEEEVEKDK